MMTEHCSYRVFSIALVTLFCVVSGVASFHVTQPFQSRNSVALAAASSTASMATLTEETTWTLRMNLENLPTKNGKKSDGIYVVQAKFAEEEGYEPPQGNFQQVFPVGKTTDENDTDDVTEERSTASTSQMTVRSGRWTLSEDPNDRKDSLWYVM